MEGSKSTDGEDKEKSWKNASLKETVQQKEGLKRVHWRKSNWEENGVFSNCQPWSVSKYKQWDSSFLPPTYYLAKKELKSKDLELMRLIDQMLHPVAILRQPDDRQGAGHGQHFHREALEKPEVR